MAGATVNVTMDVSDAFKKLDAIPIFFRGMAVEKALKAAAGPIRRAAQNKVQQPGKPGYYARYGATRTTFGRRPKRKQGKKMLRDTIGYDVSRDHNIITLKIGPKYPAGAHGHLVEHGHDVVTGGTKRQKARKGWAPKSRTGRTGMGVVAGRAQPFPFLEPAAQQSEQQALQRFNAAINRYIREWRG